MRDRRHFLKYCRKLDDLTDLISSNSHMRTQTCTHQNKFHFTSVQTFHSHLDTCRNKELWMWNRLWIISIERRTRFFKKWPNIYIQQVAQEWIRNVSSIQTCTYTHEHRISVTQSVLSLFPLSRGILHMQIHLLIGSFCSAILIRELPDFYRIKTVDFTAYYSF